MAELSFVGSTVSRVMFDYACTFRTEDKSELRVETLLAFASDGRVFSADPADPGLAALHLLATLKSQVMTAHADDEGRLKVSFGQGRELVVEPDPDYEAWTFYGGDGSIVVCNPGGGLSTWVAEPG